MSPELYSALLPAVFGLIGVAVGGWATWRVEVYRTERLIKDAREQKDWEDTVAVHQGARLLFNDISELYGTIKACLKEKDWSGIHIATLELEGWKDYRAILVSHLSDAGYDDVISAVSTIKTFAAIQARPPSESAMDANGEVMARDLMQGLMNGMLALKPWLSLPVRPASPVNPPRLNSLSRIRSHFAGSRRDLKVPTSEGAKPDE
jgi:hypothetical protein